jgi:multiple sugar transport system permease protein
LPFWTIIFLAGRMAIPTELYEAAKVTVQVASTCSGTSLFHAGEPLSRLHLLSSIWALGDFNAVRFISGGGPALSTHVLASSASAMPLRSATRR